jgi:hypothetical protein
VACLCDNDYGELAIMSIETYEKFYGRNELYYMLDEAIAAEEKGDFVDYDDFISDLYTKLNNAYEKNKK